MDYWPHEVTSYTSEEVAQYCARDSFWQTIRIGIRGKPTQTKLDILDAYRYNREMKYRGHVPRFVEVQTSNYINALRRAKFLTAALKVRR